MIARTAGPVPHFSIRHPTARSLVCYSAVAADACGSPGWRGVHCARRDRTARDRPRAVDAARPPRRGLQHEQPLEFDGVQPIVPEVIDVHEADRVHSPKVARGTPGNVLGTPCPETEGGCGCLKRTRSRSAERNKASGALPRNGNWSRPVQSATLSVPEAAKYLGLSVSRAYQAFRQGRELESCAVRIGTRVNA